MGDGAQSAQRNTNLGFGGSGSTQSYDRMKERMLEELKKTFRPEFLNRLDEIIVFHPLEQEHTRKIVDLMLNRVIARLTEKDIKIEVSEAARDYLAKEGFDPQYGARPLRRAIQRMVEDSLSEEILSGHIKLGDSVRADIEGEKLVFSKV